MTALHMLDTDVASFVIKGRSQAVIAKLAEIPVGQVCISAITQAELRYGLKRLSSDHRLHFGVQQFLELVHVLAWDSTAADQYADIRHQLVTTGQPIGELDMMIAGHALAIGAILVTNNARHFDRISAPLMRANWDCA